MPTNWVKSYTDLTNVNKGYQYELGDIITIEGTNVAMQNAWYAVDLANNALSVANNALSVANNALATIQKGSYLNGYYLTEANYYTLNDIGGVDKTTNQTITGQKILKKFINNTQYVYQGDEALSTHTFSIIKKGLYSATLYIYGYQIIAYNFLFYVTSIPSMAGINSKVILYENTVSEDRTLTDKEYRVLATQNSNNTVTIMIDNGKTEFELPEVKLVMESTYII